MKKVTISSKPTSSAERRAADAWVDQQNPVAESEPTKRLTIDIPHSLHLRVKSQCVLRGVSMVDVVKAFLEREFKTESSENIAGAKPTPKTKK